MKRSLKSVVFLSTLSTMAIFGSLNCGDSAEDDDDQGFDTPSPTPDTSETPSGPMDDNFRVYSAAFDEGDGLDIDDPLGGSLSDPNPDNNFKKTIDAFNKYVTTTIDEICDAIVDTTGEKLDYEPIYSFELPELDYCSALSAKLNNVTSTYINIATFNSQLDDMLTDGELNLLTEFIESDKGVDLKYWQGDINLMTGGFSKSANLGTLAGYLDESGYFGPGDLSFTFEIPFPDLSTWTPDDTEETATSLDADLDTESFLAQAVEESTPIEWALTSRLTRTQLASYSSSLIQDVELAGAITLYDLAYLYLEILARMPTALVESMQMTPDEVVQDFINDMVDNDGADIDLYTSSVTGQNVPPDGLKQGLYSTDNVLDSFSFYMSLDMNRIYLSQQ